MADPTNERPRDDRVRPQVMVLDSSMFFSTAEDSMHIPNSDPTISPATAGTPPPTEGASFDNRYSVLEKSSTRLDDDAFNYGTDDVAPPPANLQQLANLNEVSIVRNSCIEAIVTNTVGLGYRIKKLDPFAEDEGSDKVSEKIRRQLERWAARSEMTLTELLSYVKNDEETTGNGYLEVSRNGKNEVDGLYHIPSVDMRVRKDRKGFIQEKDTRKVGFYKFGDKVEILEDGRIKLLPDREKTRNEVIHFKRNMSAVSTYYGRPRDMAAIVTIAGDEMARAHNLKFFTNSAVPDIVLIFEVDHAALGSAAGEGPLRVSIPEGVKRKIMEHFRRNLSAGTFEPGVFTLPSGIKLRIEKMSQGQKDSGWVNYRKENRVEIRMAFRCPPCIIGDSSAGYASAAIEKALFLEQVIGPEQLRYSERLMGLLWPELVMIEDNSTVLVIGEDGKVAVPPTVPMRPEDSTGVDPAVWVLEFKKLSIADKTVDATVHQILGGIGAETVNEIRLDNGRKPIPGGDKAAVPTKGTARGGLAGAPPAPPRSDKGLSHGGRGPNGTMTAPPPRRLGDSTSVPANAGSIGTPGYALSKRVEESPDPDLTGMNSAEIEEVQAEMGEDFPDHIKGYLDQIEQGYNTALDGYREEYEGNQED